MATAKPLAAYIKAGAAYGVIVGIEVVCAGVAALSGPVHPLADIGDALPLRCPYTSKVKYTSQLKLYNLTIFGTLAVDVVNLTRKLSREVFSWVDWLQQYGPIIFQQQSKAIFCQQDVATDWEVCSV